MGAYVLRNAAITIDATTYQGQLKTCELTPSADTQTYPTLDPDTVLADVDTPTWTLHLVGPQNWTTAEGLARYLTDNHGKVLDITLEPKVGAESWDLQAIAMATAVGGERGNYGELDVELPVVGQPTITDPV